MAYATRIRRLARMCPLAYADRVCSRYQATMASRAFSAASWEPSASALEPSPNSYFVLPVASRIIRWAKGRARSAACSRAQPNLLGVRRGSGHPPPPASYPLLCSAPGPGRRVARCYRSVGWHAELRILGAGDDASLGTTVCMARCCMCTAVHARLRDVAELVVRVRWVWVLSLDSPAEARRGACAK